MSAEPNDTLLGGNPGRTILSEITNRYNVINWLLPLEEKNLYIRNNDSIFKDWSQFLFCSWRNNLNQVVLIA
jgi:hypothetical protein